MTASVADVDPVAIALAALRGAPWIDIEFAGVEAVSGLNEPPYPHLRVRPSTGGDDGRLLWSVTGEIIVESWGEVDGRPGSSALRRLLYVATTYLARLPDRPHVAGHPVVTDVRGVGSARWVPDRSTRQPCWAATLVIAAHPDNSTSVL